VCSDDIIQFENVELRHRQQLQHVFSIIIYSLITKDGVKTCNIDPPFNLLILLSVVKSSMTKMCIKWIYPSCREQATDIKPKGGVSFLGVHRVGHLDIGST